MSVMHYFYVIPREQKNYEKLFKKFKSILKPYFRVDREGDCYLRVREIGKEKDKKYAFIPITVTQTFRKGLDKYKTVDWFEEYALVFYSDFMRYYHSPKNMETWYTIAKKVISRMNPLFAGIGMENESIISFYLEYYYDPYFFCVEPQIKMLKDGTETHAFLFDKKLKNQMDECKKVLPEKELLELIEKYSDEVIQTKSNGIGVIKKEKGTYERDVYPRYFIRKELRRRGVELEEGLIEEHAKELASWGKLKGELK